MNQKELKFDKSKKNYYSFFFQKIFSYKLIRWLELIQDDWIKTESLAPLPWLYYMNIAYSLCFCNTA